MTPTKLLGVPLASPRNVSRTLDAVAIDDEPKDDKFHFVHTALTARLRKEFDLYTQLLAVLNPRLPQAADYLRAVSQCVTLVDSQLVGDLFDLDFFQPVRRMLPHESVAAQASFQQFQRFLCHVVSCRAESFEFCLACLVNRFAQPAEPEMLNSPSIVDTLTIEQTDRPEDMVDARLFSCLKAMLDIVPTGTTATCDYLFRAFPHPSRPLQFHEVYFRNYIQVMNWIPVLIPKILAGAVRKAVLIDVEIKTEEPMYDDDAQSATGAGAGGAGSLRGDGPSEQGMFALDEATPGDGEMLQDDDEGHDEDEEEDDMALKMDVVMSMLFDHLKLRFLARQRAELDTIFASLMDAFQSTIITTHRCRCVQFLLFYMTSLSPSYADAFLAHLFEVAFNTAESPSKRLAAIGYMASFIARAKFVSDATTKSCLERLTQWTHSYLATRDSYQTAFDTQVHGVFYAVSQAIFYISCFRLDSIVNELYAHNVQQGVEFVRKTLKFDVVCQANLNPLRLALPTVAHEFARTCLRLEIYDARAILRANTAIPLPPTVGEEFLDAFFPFDPYILTNSSSFIRPVYRKWHSNNADYDLGLGDEGADDDQDDPLSSSMGDHTHSYQTSIAASFEVMSL